MKILTNLVARILFAVPIAMFGIFHFAAVEDMVKMAPFGGVVLVYLTGVALLAATVSILIKKKAALATLLLGVFFLLTATTVHLRDMMGGNEMAMGTMLRDLALAGSAWFMSGVFRSEEQGSEDGTGSTAGGGDSTDVGSE